MLKKIHIRNFKSIIDTTINAESDYNVFIGANNNGKSSLFEAIHLWKLCYDLNIKKKHDGFYSQAHNLLFRNLGIIRVIHDRDIYPHNLSNNELSCTITLTFELNGQVYALGFKIDKPTSIDDAYLQINYVNDNEFIRFANAVSSLPGYTLVNVISVNESRPIANIIVNEPKMTTAEIRDKISKGKGHEVLRNKIINNASKISEHINEVTGEYFNFSYVDIGAYIEMKVNGKDILSCGSGFIQLAELFASIEYTNSLIKILLIDEPDAHIHVKLQRKLVNRLKTLSGYQLFIISHNERFVRETEDSKLFHICDLEKSSNNIKHIDSKIRPLIVEGLTGIVNELDKWQAARKIVLVEGSTDKTFLESLVTKYCAVTATPCPLIKYYELKGIDTLYSKLDVITRSMKDVVQESTKWLLIRDTDCYPISKLPALKAKMINPISRNVNFEICYQNGYGIESTYLSDTHLLSVILSKYYGNLITSAEIEPLLLSLNTQYASDVKISTNRLYSELKNQHFDRQSQIRKQFYHGISFQDVLNEINNTNIQYIMTKPITTWYYEDIHAQIMLVHPEITKDAPQIHDIEQRYLDNITSNADILGCHQTLIAEILNL